MTDDAQTSEWHIPASSTSDEFWDRLGRGDDLGESETWTRIDGILPDTTVYFRRELSDAGPSKITGLCVIGSEITAEALRAIPMVRLENFDEAYFTDLNPEQLGQLHRPDYDDPTEFSRTVAFHYRYFAARSSSPAKDMAKHSHVPIATARRWIHEARLRGLLAPGRRGKAG